MMRRLLLVLCLALTATPAWAQWSETNASQRAFTASVTGDVSLASPGNVTSGHLVIVSGCTWRFGEMPPAPASVTSAQVPSYTIVASSGITSGNDNVRTWIAYGVANGTGADTASVDVGADDVSSVARDEFTPGAGNPAASVDGGSSTGTSSTALDTITTATSGELIIGVANNNGGDTAFTPGSGYTQIGETESGFAKCNVEFQIVTTATSYNVDWTFGTSIQWQAQSHSFSDVAAATGSAPRLLLLGVGE